MRLLLLLLPRCLSLAPWWWLLLLLCALINGQDPTVLDEPWPCPGPCWITEDTSALAVVSRLEMLWAAECVICSKFGDNPCEFGQIKEVDMDGKLGCLGCLGDALTRVHRTMLPTLLPNCDLDHTMCRRNYYPNPADLPSVYGACLPCLQVSAQCPDGHFPNQCTTTVSGELATRCTRCARPYLPNHTVFQYGQGFIFSDCTQDERPGVTPNLALCAYFQTPKWGQGYCTVYCQPGFAQTAPPAREGVDLPVCVPCATACPPGFRPPECPGGLLLASGVGRSPFCQACDAALLPNNAHWVQGGRAGWCAWQCASVGFYGYGSECIACPARNSWHATQCDPQTERWLGCSGGSPGECRPCLLACNGTTSSSPLSGIEGWYLRAEVYMEACECAPCDRPERGVTFVSRNCSATANTVLQPCSNCSSLAPGLFQAAACGLFTDVRCQRCTVTGREGLLRVAPCSATADAVFIACPFGYACNGSAVPRRCDAPRLAVNGVCVCPPATVTVEEKGDPSSSSSSGGGVGGGCVPVQCPMGQFPDPSYFPINRGCRNCTLLLLPPPPPLPLASLTLAPEDAALSGGWDVTAVRTRSGVLGFEACVCREGFFRRVSYAALSAVPLLSCWPCGDMGCSAGIERQAPLCDGTGTAEPQCKCGVGPGMKLVVEAEKRLDAPCAAECAPGYVVSSSSSTTQTTAGAAAVAVVPALLDAFSLVSFVGGTTTQTLTWADGARNASSSTTTAAAGGCPFLKRAVKLQGDAVLVLCGGNGDGTVEGQVWVVRTDTGRAQALDLSIFEQEGVRAAIRGRDLLHHKEATGAGGAVGGLVWFLFEFRGLCAQHMDTGLVGVCSGFELLLPEVLDTDRYFEGDRRACAAGVCVLQGSQLWGNTFQGRAAEGLMFGAAWGPRAASREGSLYFMHHYHAPLLGDGAETTLPRVARYDIVFYESTVLYTDRAADPVLVLPLAVNGATIFAASLFVPAAVGGVTVGMDGLYVGLLRLSDTTTTPKSFNGSSSSNSLLWQLVCPDAVEEWSWASTGGWLQQQQQQQQQVDEPTDAAAAAAAAGTSCTAAPINFPTAALRLQLNASFEKKEDEEEGVLLLRGGIKALSALPAHVTGGGGEGGGHLLFAQDLDGAFCTIDLLNGFVSRVAGGALVREGLGGVWVTRGILPYDEGKQGVLVGVNLRQTTVHFEANMCPVDTFALYASVGGSTAALRPLQTEGGCIAAQCVRAAPCGPNSRRRPGQVECECDPGFALVLRETMGEGAAAGLQRRGRQCMRCDQAAMLLAGGGGLSGSSSSNEDGDSSSSSPFDYYCPGGSAAPERCQAHSVVTTALASSRSDCQCVPGYFLFQAVCILCPTSLWCPFNGTIAPIQCYGGGFTYSDGTSSPLDCLCPKRTFGLQCTPCDDRMECSTSKPAMLASLSVEGWGPVWGNDIIRTCLTESAPPGAVAAAAAAAAAGNDWFLLYPVLGVSRRSLVDVARQSAASLAWSWILVVVDADPWTLAVALRGCLGPQFTGVDVQVLARPVTKRLNRAVSCGGRHWEYSGNPDTEGCVCVAGYEELITDLYGQRCFPCPNGTYRPRRHVGGCMRCLAENFEKGGAYLGMSECVCLPGYERDNRTRACQRTTYNRDEAQGSSPPWYQRVGSLTGDTAQLLLLSIGGAMAALMFNVVLVCVL